MVLLISPIHGQSAAQPEFEVASIKLAPPSDGRGRRISMNGGPGSKDPGLFTCENCSVGMLISAAYGVKRYQLTGSPDWLENNRFLVSAKIREGATKEQFRLMQQALLADRFGLKVHWDTKEMQMYELVVAKGGVKIKEAGEPPLDDAPPATFAPGPAKLDPDGFPILPAGRGPIMIMERGKARYKTSDSTMEELAVRLAGQLDKPVTDATGLKGKYEFTLSWDARGESTSPDSDADSGPTLFAALQQQLGLKLEPKKGMVDVLVIDKVEKTPTEN